MAAGFTLLLAWRATVLANAGPLLPASMPAARPGVAEAIGVLHVHTLRSHDGRADVDEIVADARPAGLDFVLLVEHDNFGVAAEGKEGWRDGVLIVGGEEAGTCDRYDEARKRWLGGHLLVLGPTALEGKRERMTGEELAALAVARGGAAFAAHPTNRRVPWRASDRGLAGLEFLNVFSAALDQRWWTLAQALLCYPLNAAAAMTMVMGEPRPQLAYFDALAARRRVAALGGADAHSCVRVGKRWRLPLPAMSSFFGFMRTHVQLPGPFRRQLEPDRRALFEALASGRSFVGLDWLAPSNGFDFVADAGQGVQPMGAAVSGPRARLRATAPDVPGLTLELYRDGEKVASSSGPSLEFEAIGDGAYRCEAWLEGRSPFLSMPVRRPWIFSNPIFVGSRYAPTKGASGAP